MPDAEETVLELGHRVGWLVRYWSFTDNQIADAFAAYKNRSNRDQPGAKRVGRENDDSAVSRIRSGNSDRVKAATLRSALQTDAFKTKLDAAGVPEQNLITALTKYSDQQYLIFLSQFWPHQPSKRLSTDDHPDPFEPEDDRLFSAPSLLWPPEIATEATLRQRVQSVVNMLLRATKPDARGIRQGYFCFYRLGVNDKGFTYSRDEVFNLLRFEKHSHLKKFPAHYTGRVIRRVPARLVYNPKMPTKLWYEEFYDLSNPEDARKRLFKARASACQYFDYLTILSEDALELPDGTVAVEPSLTHFKLDAPRQLDSIPGVVMMRSDANEDPVSPWPTAYKAFLRPLRSISSWHEAKQLSLSLPVVGKNDNGRITAADFTHRDGIDDPSSLASFYRMLNIKDTSQDLFLADKAFIV